MRWLSARDAGRVDALKGINLSLAGGELTLLMGPSGSGKTTLLSVLGCMLSPTGGTRANSRPLDDRARLGTTGANFGGTMSGSYFNPIICFRL